MSGVLTAALALGAGAAGAYVLSRPKRHRSGGDQSLERVADGVYVYRGHFSNSGVLVLKERVVLVDTQVTPLGARRLKAAVRKVTALPVTHVVNTHYHGDHVGGNGEFPDAEILATAQTARFVVERDPERVEYAHTFGLEFPEVHPVRPPTRTFEGQLALTLDGERLELLQIGAAETPDACVLWCPDRGVLFCGDTVAPTEYPWTGVPFLDEGLKPDGEWVGALERIAALEPRVLISGHGPPLVGEARIRARLHLLRSLFTDLFEAVAAELAAGTPLERLVSRVDTRLRHYPDRPDLEERVLCQRFAIYKAVNGLLPERRGRGWWHDLRPSVIRRAPEEAALAAIHGLDAGAVRALAIRESRRDPPLALSALEAWLGPHPADARTRGLLSDLLMEAALSTRPFVDAMELFAFATRQARTALEVDPDEPLARLTLGSSLVWGAMVLAFPMEPGVRHLEAALASGALTRRQGMRALFFLGKAHQMDLRDDEADRAWRALLPAPLRFAFPLIRSRLKKTP